MSDVNEEIVVEEPVTEEIKEKEEVKAEKPAKTDSKEVDTKAIVEALRTEIAESIRKEEKDKLYPTIEKAKTDLKEKEAALKAAEAKLKDYEDSNLSNEEKVQKQLRELAEANQQLAQQLENVSEAAAREIYSVQLAAAKDKALAKYGDSIIPEMIVGSTIEEIYQSAEKANSVYLTIKAKAEEDAKRTSKTVPVGSNISTKSVNPAGGLEMDIQDIRNITDPAEWAKVVDKLKEKAFSIG